MFRVLLLRLVAFSCPYAHHTCASHTSRPHIAHVPPLCTLTFRAPSLCADGAGKTTSKKPQQAVLNKLPLLKKPLEQIGKLIKVPGSF